MNITYQIRQSKTRLFDRIESIEALKMLMKSYLVVAISRWNNNRYTTFLDYFEQHGVTFDAAYIDTRKDQYPFQDYSQILKDFSILYSQIVAQALVKAHSHTIDYNDYGHRSFTSLQRSYSRN